MISASNVETFAKLTSYISEIEKYPKSIAISNSTYWCDTKDQVKETGVDAKSAIIANKDKIIICYNASAKSNHIEYSKQTKNIADINVPTKLYDDFYQFYDHAKYYTSNDSTAKAKSLGVILGDCLKYYPQAKIYLAGDKLGGAMAALTYLHIVFHAEAYKVKSDQLNLYTYGELPWCHQDSIKKAKELLKNHHQVIISDDDIKEPHNYKSTGEKYYLKSGHLLSYSEFKKTIQADKLKTKKDPLVIKNYIDECEKKNEELDKKLE